jgi:hypothetical protein
MKELEVYVISSALGKTGIHWRKVESSQSVLGYPDMLEKRLVKKKNGDLGTIEYRINYQKLSFVIMRHSQQLLFLVAGIEALEERSNQLGSTIYNAVAWVANPDESNSISPENELMLRHLAARALLSFVGKDKDPEFINTINEAINFKGLEEFEVNLNKIKQLTENSADKLEQLLPNLDKAEADQQIWYKKVEKTSNEQEIISLAEKIIKTGLPEDDLAILISKGDENAVSVSPIDLKTEQSEVNQDKEDQNSTSKKVNETKEEYKPIPGVESEGTKKPQLKIKLLLVSLVLLSLLLVTVLLLFQVMKNQQEQPEKIPIPQTLLSPQPPVPLQLMKVNL